MGDSVVTTCWWGQRPLGGGERGASRHNWPIWCRYRQSLGLYSFVVVCAVTDDSSSHEEGSYLTFILSPPATLQDRRHVRIRKFGAYKSEHIGFPQRILVGFFINPYRGSLRNTPSGHHRKEAPSPYTGDTLPGTPPIQTNPSSPSRGSAGSYVIEGQAYSHQRPIGSYSGQPLLSVQYIECAQFVISQIFDPNLASSQR